MIRYFYKFFVFSISRFLILIDFIFRKIFNKHQFLPLIHDYIESTQYYEKIIHKIQDKVYFLEDSKMMHNRYWIHRAKKLVKKIQLNEYHKRMKSLGL